MYFYCFAIALNWLSAGSQNERERSKTSGKYTKVHFYITSHIAHIHVYLLVDTPTTRSMRCYIVGKLCAKFSRFKTASEEIFTNFYFREYSRVVTPLINLFSVLRSILVYVVWHTGQSSFPVLVWSLYMIPSLYEPLFQKIGLPRSLILFHLQLLRRVPSDLVDCPAV